MSNDSEKPPKDSYSQELRGRSEAGEVSEGWRLLQMFAQLADDPGNAHPEIVRHVARCVSRAVKAGAITPAAFCVKRSRGAPAGRNRAAHVLALRAYLASLADGKPPGEATENAVKAASLGTESVNGLIGRKRDRARVEEWVEALLGLTAEQRAALATRE